MFEWIKIVDIFGKKVELKVDGRDSYKSYSGAAVTISYGIAMIVLSVLAFKTYLSTTSPSLIGESYQRSLYPDINLENNKLMPFFIGYSSEIDLISPTELSKYFTFTVEKIVWKTTVDGDGVATLEKLISYEDAVACGSLSEAALESYDYIGKGGYLTELLRDYSMCLPSGAGLRVFGKGSDEEFGLISFKIKPCSLPTGCATAEEMGRANFQWVLPASTFDSSNKETPKSTTANADDVYYINPAIRQIYVAKFKENVVLDSEGLFDPDLSERIRYFDQANTFTTQAYRDQAKIECTPAETRNDSSLCYSYFEFSFQSSGTVFNYKRSYKTLGDTLGEIGGLNGIVILVFALLAKPLLDWVYDDHLFSSVYSFLRDENGRKLFGVGKEEDQKEEGKRKGNGKADEGKLKGWCKMKEKDKKWREMRGKALDMIDENVDIVSIVKDINTIKVIAGIFLKDRHRKLAEVVQFKAMLDEEGNNPVEKKKKCKLQCGGKKAKGEGISIRQSLEELKRGSGTDSPRNSSSELNQLVQQISDTYFKDVLFSDNEKGNHLNSEQIPFMINLTHLLGDVNNNKALMEIEMGKGQCDDKYHAEGEKYDDVDEHDGYNQPLRIPNLHLNIGK